MIRNICVCILGGALMVAVLVYADWSFAWWMPAPLPALAGVVLVGLLMRLNRS